MRKSYMTLCMRGNTEVTHILKNGKLEVTFEQAVNGGFNTAVFNDNGLVSNNGFSNADIAFFTDFYHKNASTMLAEARGEF